MSKKVEELLEELESIQKKGVKHECKLQPVENVEKMQACGRNCV
jgi:predicted metal-binding protein